MKNTYFNIRLNGEISRGRRISNSLRVTNYYDQSKLEVDFPQNIGKIAAVEIYCPNDSEKVEDLYNLGVYPSDVEVRVRFHNSIPLTFKYDGGKFIGSNYDNFTEFKNKQILTGTKKKVNQLLQNLRTDKNVSSYYRKKLDQILDKETREVRLVS